MVEFDILIYELFYKNGIPCLIFRFLKSCVMYDRKHTGLVLQTSTGSGGKAEIHRQHQVWRSCPFRGFRLHRTILQDLSSDWFAWGGTNQIWKVPVFAGRVKYYFGTGLVIFKSYLWHIGHVYWKLNDCSKFNSFWIYLKVHVYVHVCIRITRKRIENLKNFIDFFLRRNISSSDEV